MQKSPCYQSPHSVSSNEPSTTLTRLVRRKSAVERLRETKANYVKSERVLDSDQEFKSISPIPPSSANIPVLPSSLASISHSSNGSSSSDAKTNRVNILNSCRQSAKNFPSNQLSSSIQSSHQRKVQRSQSACVSLNRQAEESELKSGALVAPHLKISPPKESVANVNFGSQKPQIRQISQRECDNKKKSGCLENLWKPSILEAPQLRRLTPQISPNQLSSSTHKSAHRVQNSQTNKLKQRNLSSSSGDSGEAHDSLETRLRQLIFNSKELLSDENSDDFHLFKVQDNGSLSRKYRNSLLRKSMPDLSCRMYQSTFHLERKPGNFVIKDILIDSESSQESDVDQTDQTNHQTEGNKRWKRIDLHPSKAPELNSISDNLSRARNLSRSKSDVSHRLLRPEVKSLSQVTTFRPCAWKPKSKYEAGRFFDTLGLDSSGWESLVTKSTSGATCGEEEGCNYFESIESIDSAVRKVSVSPSSDSKSSRDGHHHHHHQLDEGNHRPTAVPPRSNSGANLNASAQGTSTLDALRSVPKSLSCHQFQRDFSIVEKNARVIKWLINCRKAALEDLTDQPENE